MKKLLLDSMVVGSAGFAGAITRYWVGLVLGNALFPVGTLAINVTGCLALGWVMTVVGDRTGVAESMRLALAVGFLGAYTTFSTFMHETHGMLGAGLTWKALTYVGASLVLGLVAVKVGIMAGR